MVRKLRDARGFEQQDLARVVDLSVGTIAKLETGQRDKMHPGNAHRLMLALAAEGPFTEEDAAWWLELTTEDPKSRNGVLDENDRIRLRELGVIVDPARDPAARSMLPAFTIYGPRIASVRGVGMSDVLAQRRKPTHADRWRQFAHELVDQICAHGGRAPGFLVGELGRMLRELDEAAAARAAPNEAIERAGPSSIVAEGHKAYPTEGRVVTTYTPEPAPTPPPPAKPAAPAKPQAKRKSG